MLGEPWTLGPEQSVHLGAGLASSLLTALSRVRCKSIPSSGSVQGKHGMFRPVGEPWSSSQHISSCDYSKPLVG